LVAGDDPTALSGHLTYGGSAQGAVLPGSYTLTASGVTSGNYDIRFMGGQLDISRPAILSNEAYGATVARAQEVVRQPINNAPDTHGSDDLFIAVVGGGVRLPEGVE
ncbi:MAG TPA: MBG domain-containing protein, partial [Rhodocyclaceae bacterium]|nr:MBG domain-containing protein [Rhodocyclaceae bacterium]